MEESLIDIEKKRREKEKPKGLHSGLSWSKENREQTKKTLFQPMFQPQTMVPKKGRKQSGRKAGFKRPSMKGGSLSSSSLLGDFWG